MAIITLTTDMGLKDHYVAAVKGALLTQQPGVLIVDITHQIKPFDNAGAAFTLGNVWAEFPKGTIHIIGVNPEADAKVPHLVVVHEGHYFIGADTGIFSLLFDKKPLEAFELTLKLDADHRSFPVKNVFVKVACHLARGGTPDVIGRRVAGIRGMIGFQPATDPSSIRGKVVHVDGYGNLVTNITRKLFDDIGKGRVFQIAFASKEDAINRLHGTYTDVPDGEKVAFFGSTGLLEIAVNKGAEGHGGGAARLFGAREGSSVRVEFAERR
jgi:S-adenosyl-L-methionine hydrolase (adenosine-forming)